RKGESVMKTQNTLGQTTLARRGFTLLEMMLVLVIMGALMSVAVWSMMGQGTKGKIAATVMTMDNVHGMIDTYFMDYNAYPPSLDVLVPKYTPKKPVDAWKREIKYVPGTSGSGAAHPYQLYSTGPSGNQGDPDNIDYWTSQESPASSGSGS